jgi:TonB family protein
MKSLRLLLAAGCVFVMSVGSVNAQTICEPGNGVSLPKVEREVPPPAADTNATVRLACVVREDGTISDITVEVSPDAKLDQAAIDTLSQWRFRPGMKDGRPVPVRIHVELSFTRK